MPAQDALRDELVALLSGGNAHLSFEDALADFPADLRGRRPRELPYSGWELLEHMRLAQNDILEFCRDPAYQSPPWPEGYWPKTHTPPSEKAWQESVEGFMADRRAMLDLVKDPKRDLLKPFAHGTGQTLAREALLAADHTAYHLGQMVVLRRLLGAWS